MKIKEESLEPTHPSLATSFNNLAVLEHYRGNYAKAEPLYQKTLAINEAAFGSEHPAIATTLNNLAILHQLLGKRDSAVTLKLRTADIEESNLRRVLDIGSDQQKQSYMQTLSGSTYGILSFHLQHNSNNAQASRLALTTILRRKGRVLDSVKSSFQTLRQNLNPSNQALLDQFTDYQTQLTTLIFQGLGNTPAEQYKASISELKNKVEDLENTLALSSTEFRRQIQPITVTAVQDQIPRDSALIEFVIYRPFNLKATKPSEEWGTPRYAAYILHAHGEPQWVDLGDAELINQAAMEFRQTLTSPSSSTNATARSLDKLLMEPVRPLLGDRRKILISPDSQLNLIPFAAMVDEQNQFLVENYTITYLSSGRDLLHLSTQSSSFRPPVIIADPNFEQPGRPILIAQPDNRGADNQRSGDASRLKFGPLAGTAQEAEAIAQKLQLPSDQVFTQSEATENVLKQLKGPQILHIATHGFFLNIQEVAPTNFGSEFRGLTRATLKGGALPSFDATLPATNQENPLLRSGLALAGFNQRQSGHQDGVLSALEAASLDLRGTQLVVLSVIPELARLPMEKGFTVYVAPLRSRVPKVNSSAFGK